MKDIKNIIINPGNSSHTFQQVSKLKEFLDYEGWSFIEASENTITIDLKQEFINSIKYRILSNNNKAISDDLMGLELRVNQCGSCYDLVVAYGDNGVQVISFEGEESFSTKWIKYEYLTEQVLSIITSQLK